MRHIIFTLILLGAITFIGNAQTFKAGVARADITPPPGVELWGYSNRSGPATGTLDPLFARVLYLDDGRNSVSIITLDLGRSFGRPQIQYVRQRVRSANHKSDEVMFIASHTHSGPVIDEDYDQVPEWEQRALDKIIQAINEARKQAIAARIGTGFGQAILGHNRRFIQSDGSVKMLWRNSTGQATGVIDPSVGVIRVDDKLGNPLAILVNYACHPVVFGPDNLRYSADFPGAMARVVEESFGNKAICFFLQGAPGDINPMLDKTPLAENADNEMRRVGETLGREVARVSRSIQTETPTNPDLACFSEEMQFKNRWSQESIRSAIFAAYGPNPAKRYFRYLNDPIAAPVTTLVINRNIALVGLPGEPFVGLQLLLKQRSPLAATFLCGYTNGYIGYFPTIHAAVTGGYGGNTIVTRVEVGAGERMVDRGLIHIYRALGKLKDKPEQP
ncbi:MAG TPA: neutral/alkaline non-lysosomal ceramidase N-terminal domain-containing protein [Blastocatellia bacterium]|nr:neutral/alkaline non-lysosomal ceramidase N-terminal domain-containing protein [Blastocatellia bacterium]